MKKIILSSVLATSLFSYDISLSTGWNLVSFSSLQNDTLSITDLATNVPEITTIQAFNNKNGVLSTSVNPANLNPVLGYWVQVSGNTVASITAGNAKTTLVDSGWNLVGFSTTQSITDLVTYFSNSGATLSTVQTFTNNAGTLATSVNPATINANQGYWVYISAIDFNTYIPNALPNEASDLPNIDEQTDLDNHSMITAANISNELKFYLTSVDNNRTFKKVEIPSFSATTLNGSDSDINSTVTSAVASVSSGTCGQIVLGSTDNMTISVVDNSGVVTSSLATTYNGSDGNFTIDTDYEKVVWYGDAISLDSVTDCQVANVPFPPTIPTN